MSRISYLGEIDAPAKYARPPEPPIILPQRAAPTAPAVDIICAPCTPRLPVLPFEEPAVPNVVTFPRVTLTFERMRYVQKSEDKTVELQQDVSAYIGQCERCHRIYIMLPA